MSKRIKIMDITIMLPILLVIVIIITVIFCIQRRNMQMNNLPQIKSEVWPVIVDIRVDYVSVETKKVKNEYDARAVAKEFFEYSKSVNGGAGKLFPNNDFRLKNVIFHGIWEGKKYWKIEADRFEKILANTIIKSGKQ
jgi:hypothetical protein